MRILLVDDSEDSRDITEAAILSAGYTDVVIAASASEAFEYLNIGKESRIDATPLDLILLDILMPDVDGIEACARIRDDGRYANIPILMVTSLADKDSLSSALAAGANDYITKPIDPVELLARMHAARRKFPIMVPEGSPLLP
jgi:sigma-B regulation protein RsbU (phosphoserine phosphatase)